MLIGVSTLAILSTAAFCTAGGAFWRERRRCRHQLSDLATSLDRQRVGERALLDRRELDAKKDAFISNVSHELRTPLTSIHGALALLSSGAVGSVDPPALKLLRIASTNTDRLVRLINDLLDLQGMDSGQVPLQLRPCSLSEVVAHSADTMRSMAECAAVRLEVVPAPTSLLFAGDADRMQQVLCNLLSNAIKFSPRDAVIHIQHELGENDLLLRVRDHGQGVPAAKLESMFDRFAQVDPSASRQKGGTGLGLAICRAIVTQHGGSLWAQRNDQDQNGSPGLTLCLRLPRLQEPARPIPSPVRPSAEPLVIDAAGGVHLIAPEDRARPEYPVSSYTTPA